MPLVSMLIAVRHLIYLRRVNLKVLFFPIDTLLLRVHIAREDD